MEMRRPGMNDLYQSAGGAAACRKLSTAFYARIARDPLLRPLFPGKTLHCAIEEFAAFLVQFLGGPPEAAQRRWWLGLRDSHLRLKIGWKERAAWMSNMVNALEDVDLDEPVRQALRELFERSSAHVVNTEDVSPHAPDGAERTGGPIRDEIARRWNAHQVLDEAVAAVRSGDAQRAIALADSAALREWFGRDHSILTGMLALMMRSRNETVLHYVRETITDAPGLARERYAGRTLLHEASAQGCLDLVELLLRTGADPNAHDGGGHAPLYSLANECREPGGESVVRALMDAGADVNADDGVKRCTALHMAARRDAVEIAGALLDCGARIEARDSLGDTPLRRAVNCGQRQVASLLVSRGADVHSIGSKGLTPLSAARTRAMKQILRTRA
jgi:truncated hemoglobin YjbI